MLDQFLVPFESSPVFTDKGARAAQNVFCVMPDGLVSIIPNGVLTPLCSLADFRKAYTYLFGLMALQAMEQDLSYHLWSCNTEYSYKGHRLQFSPRDVRDALEHPGCALLGVLALDGWSRSGHGGIFKANRAYLSSAYQRMGEFCFATDVNPLSSLSKHSKPVLAGVFEAAMAYAKDNHGVLLWKENLLREVVAAMRNSGHFICTRS